MCRLVGDKDARVRHTHGVHLEVQRREGIRGEAGLGEVQRNQAERRSQYLAYYDELTGLPNRRLFLEQLDAAIDQNKRLNRTVALLFLDLDRFKEVNDTLGHAVGDDLLLQFTTRVKDCLREDDTLARLGGDEFIVLLPEMERLSDVFAVADRLIEANKRPYQINGNQINVGSSIGISLYPEDGTTVQELINGADIAMYRAKREGRNRYKLFAPHTVESA